jgi:serine-type D-Ala-D-Ala carboxypeptidase/endopeptidase (penicillin-binding protein 4)
MVLAVLVLVPAAVLWATWQWAAGQAESFDMPPATSVPVVVPEPSPPLATTLASLRRTPTVLSRELNLEQFRDDVAPLIEAVNDRSCVSVSLDGVPVGGRNTTSAVIPASVQKVLVGAVALEILGPDFVYTTEVRGAGPVDGVVAGDLHLVGGGDPVLSGDWYPTSDLERFAVFNQTSLDTLADSVVAAGVRRVGGNVVGDASRYDDEWFAPGWGAGVAGLEAGPYDALMVNDARVLGDDRRASDPGQAAARELERLLADRGVVIDGTPVSGTAPDGLDLIAAIDSLPLHAIVDEMLANSDNNTAELMVKEIGLAASGEGTRPAGLAAMLAVLQGWGIDVSELVMADGSGLSPSNLLTCDAVLAVLQRFEPDGHLGTGLPVAASSGTLRNVFTDHAVAGRLLGKTGTLNNPPFNQDPPAAKGLAGYLPVDGGGSVEYVLLLNGPTISDQSEYRPMWDLLGRVLDTYPAGAGPAALGPR